MKKFLFLLVVALLALCCVSPYLAYADEVPSGAITEDAEIQQFVKQLSELNAQANAAKTDEDKELKKQETRSYLMGQFRSVLGEPTDVQPQDSNVYEDYFTYQNTPYWNIVAKLNKADTTKQIIIGAHYDALSGEGAADNVTGVAALYHAMKQLVSADIPFNVIFVAFDGEEKGMLGSYHFVDGDRKGNGGMSAEDKSNTLVMFNIDSIALGDNLYLMCENKRTDLAKLIVANSQGIVEKPYAVGTYGYSLEGMFGFGYGYYERIQGSDHTPFRLSGIPTAFFFSGSYSSSIWKFSDSSNNSNQVINTPNDTFEHLENSGVDYVARIHTVGNAIANTILAGEFVQVAENARSQLINLNLWYNGLWPSIAIAVVLVVLAVLTFVYNRKLQKKAILGTAEIKSQKIFETPSAEEIFSFDEPNKPDAEDIFTFKK